MEHWGLGTHQPDPLNLIGDIEVELARETHNYIATLQRIIREIAMQLTETEQATIELECLDANGNPADLVTYPISNSAWSSSDTAILQVVAAPDGLSAVATTPQPILIGSAIISWSGESNGASLNAASEPLVMSGQAPASVTLKVTIGPRA